MPADAPDLPALLERYERPLVRYACSILGDLEAARDVVQDTFIRLCRRWELKVRTRWPGGTRKRGSSR